MHSPTIIATSTPPGRSARGLIRLSGTDALAIAASAVEPLPVARRGVGVARLELRPGLTLPVLLLVYPGPASYTGDDVVELQAPGNPELLQRIVERLIQVGADAGYDVRHAEAGEFTARAFLGGRLTLTQAEGIAATIAARSDAELRAAALLRHNRVGRLADELAEEVASSLALVEAGIDFTDQEDVVAITAGELTTRLANVATRLDSVLERSVGLERLEAIPRVVLCGAANAGKSTLFNALLGHERAVTSSVAGTTRDVLAEPLTIPAAHGPAEILLVDVAGTAETADELDVLMSSLARSARQQADLVLHCVPIDEPTPELPETDRSLVVRTKADLGGIDAARGLAVSAHSGAGLDALRATIAERLADRAVSLAGDAWALTARHESALREAAAHLAEARLLADASPADELADPELLAAVLRLALDAIGELAGDITPDDLLGRIFANFCVGK